MTTESTMTQFEEHRSDEHRSDEHRHKVVTLPEVSPNWFAAYTRSHHEKIVDAQLAERQVESFCPLYEARHRWKNRCAMDLRLPLFPNYVFVHIDRGERARVLALPGVLSLVSFGRNLAILPAYEIEALRASIGRRKVEPHPYLVVGERVRITAGALTGIEGVLLRKKNNYRVVLAFDALMRSVAVEVDEYDLEPVGRSADRFELQSVATTLCRLQPQP